MPTSELLALPQQAVQAAAELLGRDFPGVARADRGDDVGVDDAGLQAVELAVELDARGREIIPGQIRQRDIGGREQSLVGQVVDGQAGRAACSPALLASADAEQAAGQAGLPVVHVHHLRLPRQVQRQVRHALGEEDEPLGVVGVVRAVLLDTASARSIELGLVDEIDASARSIGSRLQISPLHRACAPSGEFQRQVQPLEFGKSFADARDRAA